ncbi:hypothetical protein HHK36_009785 [Tetracentron sinense]|uniref:Interferon-related developmental regulator C-terminal domain-containing protein n=1 Tax=Tetracentron sinense TaxID=13715 RepID=A0A834ZGB4_TETSI|nr:hypothetical protein HHK36_009785 [Tetracentron sinense]
MGGGFVKHMLENGFLHDVFEFTPMKKHLSDDDHNTDSSDERLYKSPNSVLNKARTRLLNKKRMLSQGKNNGYYSVSLNSEEA